METKSPVLETHNFFSSQPIFKKNRHVWGHELLHRDDFWNMSDELPEEEISTRERTANAFAYRLRSKVGKEAVMLNFSERSILSRAPNALPPSHTIVEVPEIQNPGPDLLAALDTLKRDQYRIAVDNFQGLTGSAPLLKRADLVKISILDKTPQQILDLMGKVPNINTLMVAKGVHYTELFNLARALGFNLFQGAFFKKAEVAQTKRLTSNQVARFELFEIIERGEPDFARLSQAIAMDASISYRLLMFLNSAAFSFPVEITSIDHAVVILGWEQIKTWLRLAILKDLNPSPDKLSLMKLSAQRSNFFKLAAMRSEYNKLPEDKLFLLGLFSLLEPILDMPMKEVVNSLPLDENLKAGLRREKNVYSLWIELASRIEAADWKFVDRIVNYLNLDHEAVARSYYDAHVLTNSFFDIGE